MTELLGAEHIRDLQAGMMGSNAKLSDAILKLVDSANDFKKSNEAFAQAQKQYQFWLCVLTFLLFVATCMQVYMVYWTSEPERSIENYKALNSWSDSLKSTHTEPAPKG